MFGGPMRHLRDGRDERAQASGKTLRRLVVYLKPHWRGLLVVAALLILDTLLQLAGPYLIGRAVDEFIVVGDRPGLTRTMLLLLVVYVGAWATRYVEFRGMIIIGNKVLFKLRTHIFDRVQTLSLKFFDQHEAGEDVLAILQASCSLPFAAKPVRFGGRVLMDGGIAAPIPIEKSLSDGNRRNVLVLTRPKGYVKKHSRLLTRLAKLRYRRYPGLCRQLAVRADAYNRAMVRIERMEKTGEAFVIRPARPLAVGRVDTRKDRLYAAYDQGYADAARALAALCLFLS